jgi:hypothetical protein
MKRDLQTNIQIIKENDHKDINLNTLRFKKADLH